jgi:hypothetical protein
MNKEPNHPPKPTPVALHPQQVHGLEDQSAMARENFCNHFLRLRYLKNGVAK